MTGKVNPSGGHDFKQHSDFLCCPDQEMSGRMDLDQFMGSGQQYGRMGKKRTGKPVTRRAEEEGCG